MLKLSHLTQRNVALHFLFLNYYELGSSDSLYYDVLWVIAQ